MSAATGTDLADEFEETCTLKFLELIKRAAMAMAINCGVRAHAGLLILAACAAASPAYGDGAYSWLGSSAPLTASSSETLADRFPTPAGFQRVAAAKSSFAAWLRGLPVKPVATPVRLHDGQLKWNQSIHLAVINIDTGRRDLQQCADAVMRLRGEYLYSSGRYGDIAFNDTGSGKPIAFSRWVRGERPRLKGRRLRWSKRRRPDSSYSAFRSYMTIVFAYAGTYSLARELKPVALQDMAIGDVFIKGGFPGHAVLVADMVRHKNTGETRFLLIQSFMPAQDMHVLRNPKFQNKTPWYSLRSEDTLVTPEWVFPAQSLRRF